MLMKRFLVAIWMCLALAGGLRAQVDYRQRQLNVDDGLPSNSVRAIVQDQRGFVWMGTDEGLCRYNGIVLQAYPLPGSGSNQYVEALLPVGADSLLVGTQRGVYVFSYITERFQLLSLELKGAVTSMARDRDGRVWVATDGGGVVACQADGEPQHRYDLQALGGKAGCVSVDADNQVWVLSHEASPSVWRLNKGRNVFEPVKLQAGADLGDADLGAASMLQTGDGQRWIGTWERGLWLLTGDGRLLPMPETQNGQCLHIHSLVAYSDHQLLAGADDGLWLFDTRERSFSLFLPQHFVYAAMTDREGGVWAGTHYGGIVYVSPIARRFDAVAGGVTPCFCEDAAGRVWVASEVEGVKCLAYGSNKTNRPYEPYGAYGPNKPYSPDLARLSVHALCADGDDLWMGTYAEGVVVLQTTTGRLRRYEADATDDHSLPDPNVGALLRDRKGRLWVATQSGLCCFDRAANRFDRLMKTDAAPIDIDEDGNGRLWVATQGAGLYRYDPDGRTTCYRFSADDATTLSDDVVNCSLVDAAGTLWVGTQGGLCRYDAGADCFRRVHLNVPKQAVASIAEDQGVLWLSGDCGVLRYEAGKDVVQRFTRHDGLVSEQFLPNACLKASDGRVYLGTIRGYNSFLPYKIQVNKLLPPVYITQAQVYNYPVEVGSWRLPVALQYVDKLDLWQNDQMLSLSFASLSYCSPEKNIYAYRLEGFDKEWHYVGHDHRATYTNLPVGTYTFVVRATNNDGVWSNSQARLVVVVHPPVWWSLPAKIAYGVLAVLLVWLVLWFVLGRAERRHKKEMAQLSEAKEEEVRNARMEFFTTIAHEIRTPVSLIIGPLEQLKKREAASTELDTIDRNAHRLLELVNQLLDFRKVEQGQMEVDFAVQNVRSVLQEVASNFAPVLQQKGKRFSVTLPDEHFTAVIDREAIVKLVSNLLSNALKYTRDSVELNCQAEPQGKYFYIEVTDNGRGISEEDQRHVFEPFFQTRGSKPGTGIGLNIVKRTAEAHHGEVSVLSQPGQGTTFRVVLPTSQEVAAQPHEGNRPYEPNEPHKTNRSYEPNEPHEAPAATILLVDDNEEMLTFLATTFMDSYEVLVARDGTEALRLLEESLVARDGTPTSTIDVVVSDWMMQQMDGPELCSRMRQNQATRHIPFILLTAKTDSQSKVQAMEAGVDAFIEKPFPVKYLEACVRNLLRRFKSTQSVAL